MTQQTAQPTLAGSPPANYERFFVPAIGAPLARELVELAGLRPAEQVVDIACGTGVVTRLAAERVGAGSVVGVDVNPGMLQVARSVSGDAGIEWHEASAEALPLEDGIFDVALCQLGLQFFPDKPGALSELQRVLRPGGRVVLNVPGPTPPPFATLVAALQRHVGPEAAGFVATVFSLHEPDELRGLLEGVGFTDVRARSERKTLALPPAGDFLWQYLFSTPLAEAVGALGDDARAALQEEVVGQWREFEDGGALVLHVDVTSATARKA